MDSQFIPPPGDGCRGGRRSSRQLGAVCLLLAMTAGAGWGQTKEYVRLGGRVIAIESPGGGTSSPPQAFVTGQGSPAANFNGYGGKAGMRFTVGSAPATVTSLGRYIQGGTTYLPHLLELWAADGTTVLGSATIPAQPGGAAEFRYVPLAQPVTLQAGATYYLTSEEYVGEWWYACAPVTTTAAAGSVTAAYVSNGVAQSAGCNPGTASVTVNFLYTTVTTGGGTGNSSVAITIPAAGAVISGPTMLAASATAAAPNTVARVEFWINNVKQGEAPSAPYQLLWDPVSSADGPYNLTARLITSNNVTITSAVVPVTVNKAAIVLTQPAAGTTISGSTTVTANPVLPPGTYVSKVEFLVGSALRATVYAPGPYTWLFTPTPADAGVVYLSARLTTTANVVVESAAVNVTVPASGGGGSGSAFLTGENPAGSSGTASVAGFWGMKFTTGSTGFTATEIGRYAAATTAAAHAVYLLDASFSTILASGTVPAGRPANQYSYVPLAAPVTLAPNTTYWLMSDEITDLWHGCIPVTAPAGVVVQAAVQVGWVNGGVPSVTGCAAGTVQVPPNLRQAGGGSGITITPSGTQTINPGQSKVFTALVSSGTVTWSPATLPISQGSVAISGNTLTYTAPASSPNNLTVSFTATQGALSATAAVQVNALGISLTGVTKLGVAQTAPYTTIVGGGGALQLKVELSGLAGGTNSLVNWSVVAGR